jgi:flagellar basal-body rod modification protein FlgD
MPFVSKVNLAIYDISGSLVKSFEVGSQSAGRHQIIWDGTNEFGAKAASGIYLYKFRAISYEGNGEVFEKTAKLLLMK